MNHQEKDSELWQLIKNDIDLQGNVGAYGFESYISKLKLKVDTGTKLVLEYPADMVVDWIVINYSEFIKNSAARVLKAARELEFVSESGNEAPCPAPSAKDGAASETAANARVGKAPASKGFPSRKRTVRKPLITGLNSDYTFDNFVVGANSEFAVAAAKAVVHSPNSLYNPLFIHGESGLGKTHLLHAIGNAIREQDENTQVLYVTSEDFTNAYIEALSTQGDSLANFRRKYRKADVLLIDDVQFLSQKGKTQEEFFHTFNALFASGKQIVLSADCPASQITKLDSRLTSRFEQGLTVGLQAPELETRIAILRYKRRQWKSDLISDEALEFIALSITRSVRRLEGALVRLATFASFSQQRPTISMARQQLSDLIKEETARQSISIEEIQRRVASEFHIRVSDINGRRRTADVAHPRQVAMFLARRHTQSSLQEIGAAFGGRDHGTVIHAAKTIEKKLQQDASLHEAIERICETFA